MNDRVEIHTFLDWKKICHGKSHEIQVTEDPPHLLQRLCLSPHPLDISFYIVSIALYIISLNIYHLLLSWNEGALVHL